MCTRYRERNLHLAQPVNVHTKEQKKYKKTDKALAFAGAFMLFLAGCGMIAEIREVAADAKT